MYEIFVMLLGKNRCWYQNGRLFSIHDRLKDRTHGYFRLPVSNISDKQTVHRFILLHVFLNFRHTSQLVLRLRVRKGLFEFLLFHRIAAKRISFLGVTFGIEFDEFISDILNLGRYFAFRLRPFRTAQFIEFWNFCIRRHIFLNELNLRNRNE